MVQAENNNSGLSNFQLDNCSGRDHHSLAHLSKFTLSGAGAPAMLLAAANATVTHNRGRSRSKRDKVHEADYSLCRCRRRNSGLVAEKR
jgi:hypothetical protein